MYDMARKGNHVLEEREMNISWYEILSYTFPELAIRLDVWSWTYIRSIAYWLWQQLWTGWTLTQLKRISIGKYCMDNMKNWQQVDVPEASKELIIKYSEFEL
jgi:tRNA U55 pseudouridine synthase TruB